MGVEKINPDKYYEVVEHTVVIKVVEHASLHSVVHSGVSSAPMSFWLAANSLFLHIEPIKIKIACAAVTSIIMNVYKICATIRFHQYTQCLSCALTTAWNW